MTLHDEAIRREALDLAVRLSTAADPFEEILVVARDFEEYLKGDSNQDDRVSEVVVDSGYDATLLDQFADAEIKRLGWDGEPDAEGNYILGIREAAKFLRGESSFAQQAADTTPLCPDCETGETHRHGENLFIGEVTPAEDPRAVADEVVAEMEERGEDSSGSLFR